MGRSYHNDKIWYHPEDVISTKLWVDKIRSENVQVYCKDKLDLPHPGSSLEQDTYLLCIQTPFQLDAFWRLGGYFIGIDGMHSITIYEGLQLFTIIVRDLWGHGE
jgi:hypothetical protein